MCCQGNARLWRCAGFNARGRLTGNQFPQHRRMPSALPALLHHAAVEQDEVGLAKLLTAACQPAPLPLQAAGGQPGAAGVVLSPWQARAAQEAVRSPTGAALLIAPTGAGKTAVAVEVLVDAISSGGWCLFLAPYLAIAQQVTSGLRRALAHSGVRVALPDAQTRVVDSRRGVTADIVVCTPERGVGILRDACAVGTPPAAVVVDEVHHILDGTRGARLERLLTMLRALPTRGGRPIRLLGLTATLPTPAALALTRWLGGVLLVRTRRSTPLRVTYVTASGKLGMAVPRVPTCAAEASEAAFPMAQFSLPCPPGDRQASGGGQGAADGGSTMPHHVQALLEAGAQTLVFSRSRESTAQSLQRVAGRLPRQLQGALAVHHGHLPPARRGEVEDAFIAGSTTALFCTTTLAMGVDLPADAVLVQEALVAAALRRHAGAAADTARLQQMVGRAGRAGRGQPGQALLFLPRSAPAGAVSSLARALAGRQLASFSMQVLGGGVVPHLIPTCRAATPPRCGPTAAALHAATLVLDRINQGASQATLADVTTYVASSLAAWDLELAAAATLTAQGLAWLRHADAVHVLGAGAAASVLPSRLGLAMAKCSMAWSVDFTLSVARRASQPGSVQDSSPGAALAAAAALLGWPRDWREAVLATGDATPQLMSVRLLLRMAAALQWPMLQAWGTAVKLACQAVAEEGGKSAHPPPQ